MPDLYDTQYPGDVAGHVEAGAFIVDDGLVRTSRGDDVLFTGAEVNREDPPRRMQHTGTESVNRDIGETVKQSKQDHSRQPINDACESWQTGNVTLQDGNAVRILNTSPNRKRVTLCNQTPGAASIMYGGRDSGLRVAGPNTFYLPTGVLRVLTHTQEVWIVGVAGQVVDWIEENYA